MINKDSDIEIIISRYLSKEATPEEIKVLDDWISATPENYRSFLSQKNVWEVSHPAFNPEEIDVDNAHRKVMEKILHPNQPVSVRPKLSFLHYWQQVAAILLLPLLILSAYLYFKPASQIAETYQELFTPYGTWSVVNLPDGSKVWLNAGSSLKYPTQFNDKQRVVSMQGEAYFEVAKDPSKPFQVEMNGASITVLGTHFNVKADAESDDITATLVEGSIRFEGAKQNIVMTPNQQLTFNRSTNKVDVKEIDTDTFTAWKDGLLKYKSIPFTELIENLKDIYQVEIRIDDERLADPSITVSGTFNQKQSIEQILKVISHSLPIRWTNKTGNYHIQHAH